jgi:tRNA nucleotidyltransferase (CCA-adding enzyme)
MERSSGWDTQQTWGLIPTPVQEVVSALQSVNREPGLPTAEAYLVGGCVRDLVLRLTPHDYDVVTNLTDAEITNICRLHGWDCGLVGKSFGVYFVQLPEWGSLQVARYRVEGEYTDHRHPDVVGFTDSLEQDLLRRDFTVNAMALNQVELVGVDGAMVDLHRRTLRAVGNPNDRFAEDPLRVLRAFRFAAVKHLIVNHLVLDAAAACVTDYTGLPGVAHERIGEELRRMVEEAEPAYLVGNALSLMFRTGVLQYLFPTINDMVGLEQPAKYHAFDVWGHTLATMRGVGPDTLEGASRSVLLWAAFFHDFGKPQTQTYDADGVPHFYGHEEASAKLARHYLDDYSIGDSAFRDQVCLLVREHMVGEWMDRPTLKQVSRLVHRVGRINAGMLGLLHMADLIGSGVEARTDRLGAWWPEYLELLQAVDEVTNGMKLAVNGDDVMRVCGLTPGPEVGDVLRALTNAVVDLEVENVRETLLKMLEEYRERPRV